jgi:hypothetical protein
MSRCKGLFYFSSDANNGDAKGEVKGFENESFEVQE